MVKNSHYLYRMTVLFTISLLASLVPRSVLINNMLPVIVSAAKDKVGTRVGTGVWVGGWHPKYKSRVLCVGPSLAVEKV